METTFAWDFFVHTVQEDTNGHSMALAINSCIFNTHHCSSSTKGAVQIGAAFSPLLSILTFTFSQVQHGGSVNLLFNIKQLSEPQFTTSSLYNSSDFGILAVSLDTVKMSLGSLTIPSFISAVGFSS